MRKIAYEDQPRKVVIILNSSTYNISLMENLPQANTPNVIL